jgi:transposase
VYALAGYPDIVIVPINPRASKAYRESRRLSGASNDPLDAELLCDFVVKHLDELRVWKPDDTLTRKLRLLTEHRRTLVDRRTAETHRLAATLKEYFPQALQWFGGESSVVMRRFVTRWPTLEKVREVTIEQITAVLRECGRRKVPAAARTLVEKMAAAVPLTGDSAIVEGFSMYAQALVPIIDALDDQIARYDQAIAELWATHPDRECFDSLPGAGSVMAPRLAAAFGLERSRYQSPDEMQCYSGIAPVTEQSGRSMWTHARWGYPTFLHQTFHEFAQASIPHSAWAKAVYQEQRHRGAGHHEAIRALAFRWIRILFRLWKDGEEYDEKHHIEMLRQTRSPILGRLAA